MLSLKTDLPEDRIQVSFCFGYYSWSSGGCQSLISLNWPPCPSFELSWPRSLADPSNQCPQEQILGHITFSSSFIIHESLRLREYIMSFLCSRSGFKTGEQRSGRRQRPGGGAASWPSTGCMGPWWGTPSLYPTPSSGSQRLTSVSPPGFLVSQNQKILFPLFYVVKCFEQDFCWFRSNQVQIEKLSSIQTAIKLFPIRWIDFPIYL